MAGFKKNAQLAEAVQAFDRGRLEEARVIAEKMLRRDRRSVDAMEILGRIDSATGLLEEAAEHFRRCTAIRPAEPRYQRLLGKTLAELGRTDDALAALEKALARGPDDPQALLSKAVVFDRVGRLDEAAEILQKVCAHPDASAMAVAMMGRVDARRGEPQLAVDRLGAALDRGGLKPIERRMLLFTKARAHDKLREYDAAFVSFAEANASFNTTFDPDAYDRWVDTQIELFDRARTRPLMRARTRDELPIMIAGRPRSGTTLVEQVVDAHPAAHGIGETIHFSRLVDELASRLGSVLSYPSCLVEMTQSEADELAAEAIAHFRTPRPDAERVVSKALDNIEHLGLLSLILPAARIVITTRNPLDTCVSCFMSEIISPRLAWTRNLTHLGRVYRAQQRLLDHWRNALDLQMHEVEYERMVDEPEATIRGLIEFTGLPWNDACLQFHASGRTVMTLSYDQVNRPVYRDSIERWRRYERHLGPLMQALDDAAPGR